MILPVTQQSYPNQILSNSKAQMSRWYSAKQVKLSNTKGMLVFNVLEKLLTGWNRYEHVEAG